MWSDDKCERLKELSAVILTGNYPAVNLNKMSHIHLENIVTHLILCSRRDHKANYVSSKLARPRWWPKHIIFKDPITKLRPDVDHPDSLFKWTCTLREIVDCCSRFHKESNPVIHRLRRTVLAPKQFECTVVPRNYSQIKRLKSKENNYVSNHKKKINNSLRSLHRSKYDIHIYKTPVLKLLDITQSYKKQSRTLKLPLLNLVPIVKLYDIRQAYKIKDEEFSLPGTSNCNKLLSEAYVRLHDIYETPKQINYTKNEYMEYFSLGQTSHISYLNSEKSKPNQNKTFRNFNIPISSELGQMVVPTISSNDNAVWRLQRLEWFLKEIPQVKCEQEFPVTFVQKEKDSNYIHTYKFPKRQHYQMQCSLKRYRRLGLCKPVSVRLEKLDLTSFKYIKYLVKYYTSIHSD